MNSDELNVPLDSLAAKDAYKAALTNFSTHASEANRRAVALDAKVKKWQGVPDDVQSLNTWHKERAAAMSAAATAFSSKKALQVDRMHQAVAAFIQLRLEAFCYLISNLEDLESSSVRMT